VGLTEDRQPARKQNSPIVRLAASVKARALTSRCSRRASSAWPRAASAAFA
jgi:hypothetical protein